MAKMTGIRKTAKTIKRYRKKALKGLRNRKERMQKGIRRRLR